MHRAPARTFEDLKVAAGSWRFIRDLLKVARQVSVPGQVTFSLKPCLGCFLFPMAGTTDPPPSAFCGLGAVLTSLQKQPKYAAWLLSRLLISSARGGGLESQAGEQGGMGQRHDELGAWAGLGQRTLGSAEGHWKSCSAHHRFSVWTCLRGGAQCPSMFQLCWRDAQHPHDGPWSETHNFHEC